MSTQTNPLQTTIEGMAQRILDDCARNCRMSSMASNRLKYIEEAKQEIAALKALYGVVFTPMSDTTFTEDAQHSVVPNLQIG
jgi:hypothetical protein